MANIECYQCKYLVAARTKLNIKRADGECEIATAFGCSKRNMPLPSISRYDAECTYFSAGPMRERWRERNEEVWNW